MCVFGTDLDRPISSWRSNLSIVLLYLKLQIIWGIDKARASFVGFFLYIISPVAASNTTRSNNFIYRGLLIHDKETGCTNVFLIYYQTVTPYSVQMSSVASNTKRVAYYYEWMFRMHLLETVTSTNLCWCRAQIKNPTRRKSTYQ